MSLSHLSRVNEKLAHARVLLEWLAQSSAPSRLLEQSLQDACVQHLQLAYIFYLRELASNCRIKALNNIFDVNMLNIYLTQHSVVSSDAAEIQWLSEDSTSWLSQLLLACAQLQLSPQAQPVKKAFVNDEVLIPLLDVSDEANLKRLARDTVFLTDAYSALLALIQRQRSASAEF